jgi:hypothetical protein
MHVYWMTGALRFEPETVEEKRALTLLLDNAKIGTPPELVTHWDGVLHITGSESSFVQQRDAGCVVEQHGSAGGAS